MLKLLDKIDKAAVKALESKPAGTTLLLTTKAVSPFYSCGNCVNFSDCKMSLKVTADLMPCSAQPKTASDFGPVKLPDASDALGIAILNLRQAEARLVDLLNERDQLKYKEGTPVSFILEGRLCSGVISRVGDGDLVFIRLATGAELTAHTEHLMLRSPTPVKD